LRIISKILLFLVFPIIVLAQSTEKPFSDRQYVIEDFSGGLDTKVSEYSLPNNQGDIAENIRYNTKLHSLSKREKVLKYGNTTAAESILGMHRLYLKDGTKVLIVNHGDEIEKGNDATGIFTNILNVSTGNYRWQWLTWNDVAIGTDGYNQPVKYDGSSGSATYLGTCLAKDSGEGDGGNGTYTYKVSFYTPSYEVAFNVSSNTIYVNNNTVNLTMIPIGPDSYGGESVQGRRIYRNKNGGSTWYLLSNGNISNNTDVILNDGDTDAVLTATTYPVTYTAKPPKGKLCVIHYNRLFLANDPANSPSRLYYGDDGSVDYFVPTDYYYDIRPDDGDRITFIKNLKGLLTVGKDNSIQKVYTDGSTPSSDWSVSDPFSNIGCKATYSVQETPVGIIYLGSGGIYRFDGQNVQLISEAVTPEINDISESNLDNCWGQYHKNSYYLSYPSKKSGSSTNNRILYYDLLARAFGIDLWNANCFVTFNSGTDWDSLYSGSSINGTVYSHNPTTNEIRHSKHSDFSGNFTHARYIPTGVGGDSGSPVIEISRTGTINELSGDIDNLTGTIDRDNLTGNYTSPGLNVGATSYDKLYWNEAFVSSGDDVTFRIRSNTTEAGLTTAAWSSEFTDPSGSDISSLTANTWMQYQFNMTTGDFSHSPTLYKANNYVVRISYLKLGAQAETSIPLHWRSGLLDLGAPGYRKSLKKFQSFHSGSSGNLTYTFTTLDFNQNTHKYDEVTDIFTINLADYPYYYSDYFTNGSLSGEFMRMDIQESSIDPLSIDKVILTMDGEPLQ